MTERGNIMEERDNIKNSVKIRKCDTFFLSKMNGSFSVPHPVYSYLSGDVPGVSEVSHPVYGGAVSVVLHDGGDVAAVNLPHPHWPHWPPQHTTNFVVLNVMVTNGVNTS